MNKYPHGLAGGRIGIERESLRTLDSGILTRTRHPASLGSVYTHPNITIDYGEALLELVTDAQNSPEAVYQQLLALHQYTAQHLNGEQLWPVSMPCRLPENPEHIEIGYFGTSNSGKIKRLYRIGLSYRYGRPMQMIAGVHFNYSPPEALWPILAAQDRQPLSQQYKDVRFMAMLRNIQRTGWLICHLFGASPAVDDSFAPARNTLDSLHPHTLGWKDAATLRMSQLGYQNKTDFTVSFNCLAEYIRDLTAAVTTPAPRFEYLGQKNRAGEYQQISTHILQIANEYYSAARPKQPVQDGELPLIALQKRGIAYIELRLLDANPYDPCGISQAQIRFLEAYMLWCLLTPVHDFTISDYNELNYNRLRSACCGRKSQTLQDRGTPRLSTEWADAILTDMLAIASQLDSGSGGQRYSAAVQEQIDANAGRSRRLPERVHADLSGQEFLDWAINLQTLHRPTLDAPLDPAQQRQLDALRDASIADFKTIEKNAVEQIPFDDYLAHYFDPLHNIGAKP